MLLSGKKVILSPLAVKHISKCFEWIHDPQTTKFLQGPFPKTYLGELAWFRKMKSQKSELFFAILDKITQQYIGNIGIHHISHEHKKADIGIMIGEKTHLDRGYGTDSMQTALKYCFQVLKLNKVSLIVDPRNKRARCCYKKCGFKKIGYLKDDAMLNGQFVDSVMMTVFAKKRTMKG